MNTAAIIITVVKGPYYLIKETPIKLLYSGDIWSLYSLSNNII